MIVTCGVFFHFDIWLFITAVIYGWIISGITVAVILHRQLSHRLFEFKNRFVKLLCYGLLIIAGHGSPIGWAAVHRVHHSKTDTEEDYQSPHSVGRLKTMFSWYWLKVPRPKQMIDLLKDKDLLFVHQYHKIIFTSFVIILYMINPLLAFYFGGLGPFVCLLLPGLVNTFGHDDYSKEGGTMAKDLPFTLLFWGENKHKQHHLDANSIRLAKYDLAYFFIKLIRK